jgi:hypothetical protein
MENTKALEVAPHMQEGEALYQLLHLRKNADESGVFEVDDVTFQIVAAALSNYATQLADAQVQLAAERGMADRLAHGFAMLIADCGQYPAFSRPCFAVDNGNELLTQFQATRQPTQDKGGMVMAAAMHAGKLNVSPAHP